MNLLKKILFLLLILTPLLWLPPFRSVPQSKKEFSLETVAAKMPFRQEWETRRTTSQESHEIERALSQPYYYLGSGGQCMTFSSKDDKYVLKFFKQRKFAISAWIEDFPLPFLVDGLRRKKMQKREEKRDKLFSAFKLSFDHLPEETGMLYVHLNATEDLQKNLHLFDPQGKEHIFNLDEIPFALQRKAELAYVAIDSLISNQKKEEARQAIDRLLALQANLYRKGFRNRDPNFRHNYGLIGSKPILIDVGKIVRLENGKKKSSARGIISSRLRQYISHEHPEFLDTYDESVKQTVQRL